MSLVLHFRRLGSIAGFILLSLAAITAQQNGGSVRVRVTDDLDAIIIGATVNATDAAGTTKTATTNNEGVATVTGLAPGNHVIDFKTVPGFFTLSSSQINRSGVSEALPMWDFTANGTRFSCATLAQSDSRLAIFSFTCSHSPGLPPSTDWRMGGRFFGAMS